MVRLCTECIVRWYQCALNWLYHDTIAHWIYCIMIPLCTKLIVPCYHCSLNLLHRDAIVHWVYYVWTKPRNYFSSKEWSLTFVNIRKIWFRYSASDEDKSCPVLHVVFFQMLFSLKYGFLYCCMLFCCGQHFSSLVMFSLFLLSVNTASFSAHGILPVLIYILLSKASFLFSTLLCPLFYTFILVMARHFHISVNFHFPFSIVCCVCP